MKRIRTTLRTHLPQTPEAFTYDNDGNLAGDGLRIYSWDAENRLTSIEIRTNVITDSTLWQRVTCDYDYQHRRVRKQVYRWNPGASQYLLSSSLRFLYDGWNLIGQVDEVTGMRMSFLWGADLSGSLQGAGGVGGLKAIVVHSGSLAGAYFCQYDANGNVLALVHADTEQEAARYEYGPFGELIRATGPMATLNPFRFSTKYQDDETGLNHYGYRYYNPSMGRWLSRDPIGEEGGRNLYGFVANSPINYFDAVGWEKFEIAVMTFIEQAAVTPPWPLRGYFLGDGNNGSFRTIHRILIEACGPKKGYVHDSEYKDTGVTIWMNNDGTEKARAKAPTTGLTFQAYPVADGVDVRVHGSARNPLTPSFAPNITYTVNVRFNTRSGKANYSIWHDGFPAYSVEIGPELYNYSAVAAGASKFALFGKGNAVSKAGSFDIQKCCE